MEISREQHYIRGIPVDTGLGEVDGLEGSGKEDEGRQS